jgi:hypothetical protein
MRYPRQQAEVVGLVDNMINGITENPQIFSHCDSVSLQNARSEYALADAALADAESKAAIAAAAKLEKFNKLQQEMKKQIKLGIVDTVDNPIQLGLIGWGTNCAPHQIEIPGSPGNLRIAAQGNDGLLCFTWDKSRSGGPVRNFIVERKQFNGNWSEWQLAGTSYNNEIKLIKQPIGIKLEYQVRASNTSGQTMPTNTVAVVL